ncbi:uncharacterized protein LOC129903245 [Solanum dulcamara]|uniref:uncharacterized protein LOC129903245 n=1 Tax=Solanum dulcamara TaxID=45834 RepID=UPI0024854144|nr:uncharacterized protein LOC129903245 [Solanum dulcamara]
MASPPSVEHPIPPDRNTITVALSEEQIAWAHEIISLEQSSCIRVKSNIEGELSVLNLHLTEISTASTIPIARTQQEALGRFATKAPEILAQIRTISDDTRKDSATGVCDPYQSAPITKISNQMVGEIAVDEHGGEFVGAPAKFFGQDLYQNERINATDNPHQVNEGLH